LGRTGQWPSGLNRDVRQPVPAAPATAMSDSAALQDDSPPPAENPHTRPANPPRTRRFRLAFGLGWIDLLIATALFFAAAPIRFSYTRGDLWLDEGDYAAAAVRGFEANRWDLSDSPTEPEKMARLRHYHPPLVSDLMALAMRHDTSDRTLRTPFVIAGCLTVALFYFCGVSLFGQVGPAVRRRAAVDVKRSTAIRIVAASCAVVLLATPAHLRASSHGLPWALITLWLLALLWTLLKLSETSRPSWLVATGLFLGLLFVTSEYAVPALIAVALALPFAAWAIVLDQRRWPAAGWCFLGGAALFLVVAYAIWPAGLTGGIVKMLRHYAEMAGDEWPVRLHGVEYVRAPKYAYAVWYWDLFKPFLVFYALGIIGAVALLLLDRGRRIVLGALAYTSVIVAVAHASHIIGPEYLVHALPLLTLLGGLFFVLLIDAQWLLGSIVSLAAAGMTATQYDPSILAGMDSRSLHSRWPAAAAFLSSRWKPGDRMLAPSYGGVGRWYVLHVAHAKAHEWQVLGLPAPGEKAADSLIYDVHRGIYQFVAVGSTFSDYPGLDSRVTAQLARWREVWKSDEGGMGVSRLVIYEPPGARK